MCARRSILAAIDLPNQQEHKYSNGISGPTQVHGKSNQAYAPHYTSSMVPPAQSSHHHSTLSHRASRQSIAPPRQSTTSQHGFGGDDIAGPSSLRVSSTPSSYRASRQSVMGPPQGRPAAGAGSLVGTGSVTGASQVGGMNGRGRLSTAAGPPAAGTAQNHRRSTMAGRQSLAPGAFTASTAGPPKPQANMDPRPLKNPAYMSGMKARVHEFADRTGFLHAGYRGTASLETPTQSIFLGLFRHIYNQSIDPYYAFHLDAKKPEEEVMSLLQELKYPGLGDVSKMVLSNASSSQYWPRTLGVLDWMVSLSHLAENVPTGPLDRESATKETAAQLVRAHAQATAALRSATSEEERKGLAARVEELSTHLRITEHGSLDDSVTNDRYFYPYLWHCWERFWQEEDTFPDENAQLEELFAKKNASVRTDLERLEAERTRLDAELGALTSEPSDLDRAQEVHASHTRDLKRFEGYAEEVLRPRIRRYTDRAEELNEEITRGSAELEQLRKQHVVLSAQVASQEMTSEEFDRLSNELASMQNEINRVGAEIEAQENRRYDAELSNSNLQQKLEEKLKVFNPLGRRVGLFPLRVRRGGGGAAHHEEEELLDEIDLALGQTNLLHPGLDLKDDFRERIAQLRKRVESSQRKANEERVERQERFDEISERLHQVEEQEETTKRQLDAVKEAIEELTKLTDEETRIANEDQYGKDRQIQKSQQAGHRQLAEAETRLVELRGYQKRLSTVARESLERYKDELCAAVEECVALRTRVEESLEEIGLKVGVEVRGHAEEDAVEEEQDAQDG